MLSAMSGAEHRLRGGRGVLAVLLLACAAPACDQAFQPLEATDRWFSIFGYLDPAEQTQWIRIMPTRPLIFTGPEALEAVVTLENAGTGQLFTLRDSIFTYPYNEEVGSDGVFVHNYWTRQPIEPGTTYRFTASTPEGVTSRGEVTIPSRYSVSVALGQSPSQPDLLLVTGVNQIAFVEVRSEFLDACGLGESARRIRLPEQSTDPHEVVLTRAVTGRVGCGVAVPEKQDVWVAGSADPWPVGVGNAPSALGVLDLPTNLSNAVGFLGGVLTRLVPYESCTLSGPPNPTSRCVLDYEGPLTTFAGVVVDVECGARGIPGAILRLEPIAPGSPAGRKVRTVKTRVSGAFSFSALEHDIPYELRIAHPARDPERLNQLVFLEHVDTVTFSQGDAEVGSVGLHRNLSC